MYVKPSKNHHMFQTMKDQIALVQIGDFAYLIDDSDGVGFYGNYSSS